MKNLACLILLCILGVCRGQTGVCYTQVSREVSQITYSSSPYTDRYKCGFFGWDRCRRTLYRQTSAMTYRMQYISQFGCCVGYTASNQTCTPVCSSPCVNGGTCTAPNTCSCQPGWTGNNCGTDIDECHDGNATNCQQVCTNTVGSFTCSCNTGYTLSNDSFSCIIGASPDHVFIQVHLKLMQGQECSSYVNENIMEKATDISLALVHYLTLICNCTYTIDSIKQSRLLCGADNEKEVVYQSNLCNTEGQESTVLREFIQQWVDSSPTVMVGGVMLQVDPYCQVELRQIGNVECVALNPTTPTSGVAGDTDISQGGIIGGVVGGVAFIATVLVTQAAVIVILWRYRRKETRNEDKNKNAPTTTEARLYPNTIQMNSSPAYGLKAVNHDEMAEAKADEVEYPIDDEIYEVVD